MVFQRRYGDFKSIPTDSSSWRTGPFGFHRPVFPRPQAQNTESDFGITSMNSFVQLAYSVSQHNHISLNKECKLGKRFSASMLAGLFCQSHKREADFLSDPICPWKTSRHTGTQADQCTHADKKGTGGRIMIKVPSKQAAHWKKECPRCQRGWVAPGPLIVLQTEDWRNQKWLWLKIPPT